MPPLSAPQGDGRETLDRYATAGGMAPDRICRILADLAVSLQDLHRAGRAHGDIAPSTIGLDASGQARLLTAPLAPAANAEDAPRRDGYAAFEQYTDDPGTPCGPWTDIYALSATACALLTGLAPPSALARCVRDDYVPLAQRRGQDEQAFCAVLDSGLAMDATARPQAMDAFARALGLDLPSRAMERVAEAAVAPVARGTVEPVAVAAMKPEAAAIKPWAGTIKSEGTIRSEAGTIKPEGAITPETGTIKPEAAMKPETGTIKPEAAMKPGTAAMEPMAVSAAAMEPPTATAPMGAVPMNPAAPVAAPGERPSALEDADGLAPITNAEETPSSPTSRVALYREGQLTEPHTATQDAARDPAAAQYEAAVASVHARQDRATRQSAGEQRQAAAPGQPSRHANRPRQRAPRLLILAVCAMIAVALYMWLRPPPPPRIKSVARTSNTAPSATPNTTASSGSTPHSSVSDTSMPGASPSNVTASNHSTSTTPAANTAAPNKPTPDNTAPTALASSATSSGPQPLNGAPSISTATTPAASGIGASSTSGSATPGSGAGTNGVGNGVGNGNGNGNGSMSIANAAPTTPSDAKTSTLPPTKPAISPEAKPGATVAPADAAGKPRTAVASKTPVPVSISIRPWGEILVNGKSRGVSPPLTSLALTPGSYDITIRNNAGPDVHQNVTITAGKNATISHTFK